MSKNRKQTGVEISKIASDTLRNPNSSKIQKTLAGSALSQVGSMNQTGSSTETIASKALSSKKYNATTKRLAGSVLSQSNKKR